MCPNVTLLADKIDMNAEFVAAVVITGLVVVFIGLILLILFVSGLGKLFTIKKKEKKSEKVVVKTPEEAKPVAPAVPADDGIESEVVAVIAAAVAAMSAESGKKLVIRGIRAANNPQRRNAWAYAGLQDNTRPF